MLYTPRLIPTADSSMSSVVLEVNTSDRNSLQQRICRMYGPPSDCKGKVCRGRKSASMYPAFMWRLSLLATMRYAAHLSFETPRPYKGPFGKQVSGTPF